MFINLAKIQVDNIYNKIVVNIDINIHLENRGTKIIMLKVSANIKEVNVIPTKLFKKLLNNKYALMNIAAA